MREIDINLDMRTFLRGCTKMVLFFYRWPFHCYFSVTVWPTFVVDRHNIFCARTRYSIGIVGTISIFLLFSSSNDELVFFPTVVIPGNIHIGCGTIGGSKPKNARSFIFYGNKHIFQHSGSVEVLLHFIPESPLKNKSLDTVCYTPSCNENDKICRNNWTIEVVSFYVSIF